MPSRSLNDAPQRTQSDMPAPRISVIIPALNEAAQISETIAAARAAGFDEIIVVDGGSRDGTTAAAATADLVLSSAPGRAIQQNLGAAAASGDVLFFLHADCRPSPRSGTMMWNVLADEAGFVAGCFTQRIAAEGAIYRWLEWGNLQRVRWFQMAYGDQGLFVRREIFQAVGGFPDWPLMEDVDFLRNLRGRGRFVILGCPLTVSARRWRQRGVVRQTLRNWTLLLLFRWGVSPARLAQHYAHVR